MEAYFELNIKTFLSLKILYELHDKASMLGIFKSSHLPFTLG